MEAVGGGVKAAVEHDRLFSQALGQRLRIGAVIDQSAPGQFIVQRLFLLLG